MASGISTSVSVRDNMSAVFGNMTTAINICLGAFTDLGDATSSGLDTASINQAREALHNMEVAAGQLGQQLDGAGNEQQQLNQQIAHGTSAADGLLKKVMGIVSAYMSFRAVGAIVETADEMTNITARINNMKSETESTAEVINKIYQSAQDARGLYSDMASMVAKLGNNARDAFSSTDEIIAFGNLVQKQFVVAGASTAEAKNAMLQLTQALGSGVLRGDELNSIFEQAPNLIQNIADYMGEPIGKIREMAKDGEITADIVKNAIFSATDEINSDFMSMPMTWAQVGTSIKNQALMTFQPVLQMISDITKNQSFQTLVSGIVNGFAMIAAIATPIISLMVNGAALIIDNWSWIGPIVGGVAGIMLVYLAATKGVALAQAGLSMIMGAFQAVQTFVSIGWGVLTGSTAAASAAQFTYNSALMACPLTWILILIIAVIAAVYGIVAAINKVTGSTISATGVIVGAVSAVGAAIWNIILGVVNAVVGIGVELYNLIATFANFFANVFNDPVGAIINLFAGLFDFILGVVESAAKLIDTVLGSDLSSAVAGFRDTVATATSDLIGEQKVVMEKVTQSEVIAKMGLDRIGYQEAYEWGYGKGQGIESSVSEFFDSNLDDIANSDILETLGDYSAATADNTGKVADSLEVTEDNLVWLKDIAEREIIDRTVFRDIKVDMGGVNNVVNNNADLDSIGQYLCDTISEQMAIGAEGA